MTFTPPRIPPILETNKVPNPNDANNPGFPIGCVQQEQNADGSSPNTPPFDDGTVTIGTVTVSGNANPTVGDAVSYSATRSGNSADTVFVFSAPGETFTSGDVTWANDGATTVTCTATSATATDSPATGTLAVTVAAAPVVPVPLSLTITANGTEAFDGSANLADGARIAAKYTVTPGGVPETPAFQWVVAGDNAADVVKYKMTVIDQEPNSDGNTGLFVHWNIGGSAGGTAPASLFTTSTSIASTDANSPAINNWAPTNCVGQVSNGIGGFEDSITFTNGWTPVGGFGTGTHTYQVTVIGYNSSDSEEIRDTFSFTHTE